MKVCIIGTGGTISSLGHGPLDYIDYADTGEKLDPAGLLARFPEVAGLGEIIPVPWKAIGSMDIGVGDWLDLLRLIDDLPRRHPDLDGIVVTHGTATLEETAYFLNLTVKVDLPVVLVGAQRPASALGTDAGPNLLHAVRVAGSAEARGLGVLVLLNDEIHAAREVTKTSTLRLQTFRSPDFGLLGHADADRVVIYRRPTRRHAPDTPFDVRGSDGLPRVDIVPSYAGADGAAIAAFLAAGAKGLIVAGLAPGFVPPGQRDPLDAAVAAGIPVVMSTRSGSGRVVPREALRRRGWLAADSLTPQKARILLMLALAQTHDPATIQALFDGC
ncbi:MAG: asparaginase [Alphaproteobacteria bacterium]|nr:asparaginase [Alphaproteobacteria bacterium]